MLKITGMSQGGIDLWERNADKKTQVRDRMRVDDGWAVETASGSLPGQVSNSLGHYSQRKINTKHITPNFTAGPFMLFPSFPE